MTAARRQKMLLGILGFLVLVVIWNYLPHDDGGGGDAGSPAPQLGGAGALDEAGAAAPPRRRVRAGDDVPVRDVIDLRLASLEAPARASSPGRDPWRFVDPPPPPTPKPRPPSAAELAAQRAAQEAAERARLEAEARARREALIPKPPPFTLKLIGSFGPPSRKIASFRDDKGTIYNVREGGVLQGKFRVARIGYESVDIEFVDFPNVPPLRRAVGQ